MMNHASHYNSEYSKAKSEAKGGRSYGASLNYRDAYVPEIPTNERTGWFDSHAAKQIVKDDPLVMGNKKLSDVTSDFDLLAKYLSDWSV